ncbi:DUF4177 domain-containing protein [Sphingobacterium sp. SRCM116780]|uniref:DUF4177 domain-containing protein n=1 Tax=Sphingobacterium sp. SRCM116780 TaxID=2907623 RepID=UPI001F1C33CA|nr:DUF4177 domain-containing protein [Sphingobacterium sp. SRCM116780]UIR54779.1 DUF4177 domain-containing protein [Sphingobacterium sp. SRCM116780]
MEYRVVPFTAILNPKLITADNVADQLAQIIVNYGSQGWDYVRLESVSTYISPNSGCFGLGARPGYMSAYQMVVFSRKSL